MPTLNIFSLSSSINMLYCIVFSRDVFTSLLGGAIARVGIGGVALA